MYKRQIAEELASLAKGYPVVTLTGPRQSGKTTLVRQVFPNKFYTNLEDLDIRNLAKSDPRGFLEQFPEGGLIDEIQRVPELLSYIQNIVDNLNTIFRAFVNVYYWLMHPYSETNYRNLGYFP